MTVPATRKEAQAANHPTYFTGKPCRSGHIAARYTKSGICLECNLAHGRSAASAASKKRYIEADRERHNARVRAGYHRDLTLSRERQREKRKRHLPYYRQASAARRAAKLQATPSWLTEADLSEISKIYRECPAGMEVDHIYPLRGKNVCGLHVPSNFQYLTSTENKRKGNR